MTKAEIRRERERVEQALWRADRKLGQSNHYTVAPMAEPDPHGATLRIFRTVRDDEDPSHFWVEFDPGITAETSLRNLRILAGHEALHALLWPFGGSSKREEDVVYRLQRLFFGEVRE